MVQTIGRLFGAVDGLFRGIGSGIGNAWRWFTTGPGVRIAIALILGFTGLFIVVETLLRWLDRLVTWLEKAIVVAALLVMSLLVFNEYLRRELKPLLDTDLGGLWSLTGQMNLSLFLMVVVGFVGASLATRSGDHLSVDAIDRVLTPKPARFVKRFVALVSTLLCLEFMRASWRSALDQSDLLFAGLKVWPGLAGPINAIVWLMPGERYGPGTPYEDRFAWEDAKFDQGLDFDQLPTAFSYVEAGSDFPLWIAFVVLAVTFAVMAARFAARVIRPLSDPDVSPPAPGGRRPADVILAGLFPGALLAMGAGLWLGTGWMIILGSVMLVFLGAPLFVAVGVGTVGAWVLVQGKGSENVVIDMLDATKKQELLAIPFFVLAGNLMTRGSMAQKLIDFARALLGALPGGLGVGAILACGIFAAISGSSPVTVIAIGSLMFPMLLRDGYSERYSMGVLTTAGGLGIIIPPSIPMIVYAVMVGELPEVQEMGGADVAELFKAGILPGLFIAVMLSLYTLYVNWPRPGEESELVSPSVEADNTYAGEVLRTFGRGFLSLMLPVVVLGGIYGVLSTNLLADLLSRLPGPLGVGAHIALLRNLDFAIAFTVTEAAAVAVVYALVVELVIYRELPLKKVPAVFVESAVMMGSLFLIIVIAISLNLFFSWEQIPEQAADWMLSNVGSTLGFLIMVNLFLLALGMVMDIISAILIVAPLLAPIAAQYGIHPIHFGIMFIVNLELGYLTPPMGINLFVSSTVFERSLIEVIKSVIPFLLVMLFCLIVIVWVPELSMAFVDLE